ncbi:MAG TPA: hypothetical protein VFX33_09040 [Actinomycetales bacterium]|nr:hypothetical protein [Actinomycetales bacterium]
MGRAMEVDSEPGAQDRRAAVLRPQVTAALAAEPGPDLVTAVLRLMSGDADAELGELTARERLELVAAWDRIESFARAGKLTAIGDLDSVLNPDVADLGTVTVRPTANELAPVLRIAPRTASALVAHTRRARGLPAAMDALAEGRMIPGHLDVLDTVTRDTAASVTVALEAEAIRCAPTKTRQQLHAHLTSKAAEWDAGYATTAVQRGTSERNVQLRPSPLPGCHRIVADLPSMAAFATWHALNGIAKNTKATGTRPDGSVEDRGLPALRADAFTAILTGQADRANPALLPPADMLTRLAHVQVVVAADTLTGQSDLPAHLPAGGPIEPTTIRELAAKVPWRRLVAHPDTGVLLHRDTTLLSTRSTERRPDEALDPRLARLFTEPVTSGVLDYGTTRYRPPAHLRDHVITRDATCIGPACHHPAAGSQLDHTINYDEANYDGAQTDGAHADGAHADGAHADGAHADEMRYDERGLHSSRDARAGSRRRRGRAARGTTADYNLGPLCIRWHNAKTHGRWQLRQPQPGLFIWTSPLGRTYTRTARPLIPGWTTRNTRQPP